MKYVIFSFLIILMPAYHTYPENKDSDFSPVNDDLYFDFSAYLRIEDLIDEEKTCIIRGRMEEKEISSSIIAGCIPGFGFGHLIQNRADDGIKFMIGEICGGGAFLSAMFAAFFDTIFSIMSPYDIPEERMLTYSIIMGTGAGIYIIFKTWSIVDLLGFPAKHNRMYERLMKKDE